MQRKTFLAIFLLPLLLPMCGNRYGFDFSKEWEWEELQNYAQAEETIEQIDQIRDQLKLAQARFLFQQLISLRRPQDIRQLADLEREQNERGGSFYGYVPEFFTNPEQIPLPVNFDSLIACGARLCEIRTLAQRIIRRPMLRYSFSFTGRDFPVNRFGPPPAEMQLDIHTQAVHEVLDLYAKKQFSWKDAHRVAKNPVFQEMLQHRRDLGYIPEPLPDSEDLAYFIYQGGSLEPIDEIWKWLNPWNFFGFADLYGKQDRFRSLLSEIDLHADTLSAIILGKIKQHLTQPVSYTDQLNLGVNWGVRSWATENSLGSNIVQVKDDYRMLIRTMAHEAFHKVQLQICPLSPDLVNRPQHDFEDLIHWNFADERDRKFYEMLSYIMLEGTATYVGGKEKGWLVIDGVKEGKSLIDQTYFSLYMKEDPKVVDEVLNIGLKANGPFYGVGYHMTELLVEKYGKQIVGELLARGTLPFFLEYLAIEQTFHSGMIKIFSPMVVARIQSLAKMSTETIS